MKSKKDIIKIIVIAILAVVVAAQAVFIIFTRREEPSIPAAGQEQTQAGDIDFTALKEKIGEEKDNITAVLEKAVKDFELPAKDITEVVKNIVYSNTVVNIVASVAYPLCYDILSGLGMLDFAQSALLYPTGPDAASLFENSGYTCVDIDGQRKPVSQVFTAVGDNWAYMNEKVTVTDSSGNISSTSLWNTIDWGVTDEDSFYKAMSDMSEMVRGVLEVCLQGRDLTVNVNMLEAVIGKPLLPMTLDAAKLYNSQGESGYASCLIPLFNMLGLVDGEYPADEEFRAYQNFSDVWRAILEPVFLCVEKTLEGDVVQNLTNLLVNFVDAIERHSLCDNMKKMGLMSNFHFLATLVMGFKDAEIFNLGSALINVIESIGINITEDFNSLLDSLLRLLDGGEKTDLPDMDTLELLAYARQTTLPNAGVYLVASKEKTVDFLVDYVMQKEVIECVIDAVGLSDTDAAKYFLISFGANEKALAEFVKAMVPIVLNGVK